MKERALIIFMKLPVRGRIKKRLEKDIRPDLVLSLYRAFIIDILEICAKVEADTVIAYSPDPEAENDFRQVFNEYISFEQRGDNLGERMYNAFCDAYAIGYERAVLIGSDIPDIDENIINSSFSKLDESDVVTGPSSDGGYYLIGNHFITNINEYFMDIPWSTAEAYAGTKEKIANAGYRLIEMEILNDIDNLDDLREFYDKNKNKIYLNTVKIISENRDILNEKI